jgi:hypothetical protein
MIAEVAISLPSSLNIEFFSRTARPTTELKQESQGDFSHV